MSIPELYGESSLARSWPRNRRNLADVGQDMRPAAAAVDLGDCRPLPLVRRPLCLNSSSSGPLFGRESLPRSEVRSVLRFYPVEDGAKGTPSVFDYRAEEAGTPAPVRLMTPARS